MDSSGEERDQSNITMSYTSSVISSQDPLEHNKINFKSDTTIVEKLKFQNLTYQPGDHIALRTDPKDQKQIFGKILLIAKVPQTEFPLLYVAWHYSKYEGFEEGEAPSHLSDKQLVASNHKDWQYVQSIAGKIKLLTLEQFENLDYRERDDPHTFFMRSYLDRQDAVPVPIPQIICHCIRVYNPEQKLKVCCECGLQFHAICSRNDYLCTHCQ